MIGSSDLTELEMLEIIAGVPDAEFARMGERLVISIQAEILRQDPGIPLAVTRAMMRKQLAAALAVLNAEERAS